MTDIKSSPDTVPLYRYWQPRYWPLWVGLGFLRLVTALPGPARRAIGRGIGALLRALLPGRRRVVATNLRLCFPDLGQDQRWQLVRDHFAAVGEAIVETGLALWTPDERIGSLVRVEGIEHLQPIVDEGRGVLLLGAHVGSLELGGRALGLALPKLAVLYRPNRNPLLDAIQCRARARAANALIAKDDMRGLVRCLRNGFVVWYAPDQSHRRKYSALVPFFGEPAMTNTATTELARLGRAAVVPAFSRRLPGGGLVVDVLPPLEDFPGASPEADAARVNEVIADYVRRAPEQYYWLHRRFKGRPPPWPDPYAREAPPP